MRVRLAVVLVGVTLAGCGWIEEQKRLARRQEAETGLVTTVESGDVETVRGRLEQDRTLANAVRLVHGRKTSHRAESALTLALKQGRREMVDVLLEHGADPNLQDGLGDSPLGAAMASDQDRAALVALLLAKGADPERAARAGSNALHLAAGSSAAPDSEEVLRLLLAKASGTGGLDARGRTPLHGAAAGANVPAIRLLVERGADPNVRTTTPRPGEAFPDDVEGATPLAIVARDRQIAAAATLCSLGADPDLVDANGESARQVAARVAAAEGARPDPGQSDLARHRNMAAFLARGAGCDALLARSRKGEKVADAEVQRIANESECEAGWGWACGQAGWAFHRGEGAERDPGRALSLFRRGCETALTKNEWCCGMTGILYLEGTGVPRDPAEGARWLARGCEPADPERADSQACHRLGQLYAEGRGVAKDLARARALFKKACDAGFEKACASLGASPAEG
jgi:hypothetical protein